MRAPIHSRKHYVQVSLSTVATVARNTEQVIQAVSVADKNSPKEVEEGAIVKAVYAEFWVINSSSDGAGGLVINKGVDGQGGPVYSECIALDTYLNKKNVLFVHQGLQSNDGIGNPTNVIRGWIKIPKSKQRFGLGDSLNLNFFNLSLNDMDYCGFVTYKEYT